MTAKMATADDRNEVLARVRESLKSALLPSARPSVPARETPPRPDGVDLLEQFARELDVLGVKLYRPGTPAEARAVVTGLVHRTGEGSVVVKLLAWDDTELPVEGLGEALAAAGVDRLDAFVPAEPAQRRARLAELERAAVGLTGAQAGLADSGTLVLFSGPARPRLASLLPPVHIAVVAKSTIYATMAELFSSQPNLVREGSNLVFITGPSRSADIEQTLTLGVHGPRQVHVVLVG